MNTLLGHLRYGFRMLVRQPGLSLSAVVALALGIGLTTMMFSIVYMAVIRGMPFEDAQELVDVIPNRLAQGVEAMGVTIHDFEDWRDQQTSFEDIAAYYAETVNVGGTEGRPIRYLGAYASAHLFDVLQVQPILGRLPRPEEDHPSTPPVMLLSYRAWQDRFEGDPEIVGRTVRANAETTTIIGVMPEKFGFPSQMDAWLPLRIDPLAYPRGGRLEVEGTQLQAVARLRDGVTLEQAQLQMSTIAERLAAAYPEVNEGIGVRLQVRTMIGPEGATVLFVMLGAVFGVLLIACANVANLLLARTVVRGKEVAIRTALGASRLRTVTHLLAETLALAIVGATLGLLVAKIGIDYFNAGLATQELPLWFVATLDPVVLVFVLGLALLSTILAGIIPAMRASQANLAEVMKDDSRGSSSLRMGRVSRGLVIGQLAVSCGLLVAAGLMIRTVANISDFEYGFHTEDILTARLGLFPNDYPTEEAQLRFYEDLTDRMAARPGIHSVALTSDLPARGGQMQPVSIDSVSYASEQDHPLAMRIVVTPTYFEMLDIEPVRGRAFTRFDTEGSEPVAIVNESFAARLLPARDPLESRIRIGGDDEPWRTIVGVVPDLHLGGAGGAVTPTHDGAYIPLSQNVINFMTVAVRWEGTPMTYAALQDEVNQLDPDLPLYWVRSLAEQHALDTWIFRALGTLFVAFGLAALAMATIGLYGIMSFSTRLRTREIGVRMALGASGKNVLMLIVKQGAWQVVVGLGLGLLLAALLSRGLGVLLFGVSPWDPAIFTLVVLTLATAGVVACIVPARRATFIEPIEAMRTD